MYPLFEEFVANVVIIFHSVKTYACLISDIIYCEAFFLTQTFRVALPTTAIPLAG